MNNNTTIAHTWLKEADKVLIAAGAGMSAAAGIDYGDRQRFAELFPAFVKKGFRARYELIGDRSLSEEDFWAYWAIHVADIGFGERDDKPYRELEALTRDKDRFVFTSNADMLFRRNGFDPQRLFTPQGEYGRLQCVRACQPLTWPSEPELRRVLDHTDPDLQTVVDRAALPRCPHCGGRVFLNVRIDRHFVEAPYVEQSARLDAWLSGVGNQRLLILEFGAGFNTPGVIRWPCENLVHTLPNARMVRVNPDQRGFRWPLADHALSIPTDAGAFITELLAASTRS